ncbi:MAG: hypothetical protein EOO94_02025 [Pedobacter sp.]|nr:MAG: hypothetical protein EOO94_02025 [Pedobacter sp.]
MSRTTFAGLKFFVALSCLCIVAVGESMIGLPLFIRFLFGIGSIVTGNPVDFVISVLGLLSAGYLIATALINRRKINFLLSTISVCFLTGIAIWTFLGFNVEAGTLALASYLIFFSFALAYYVGCIIEIVRS